MALSNLKIYEYQAKNGSKVEVKIETKIRDLHKEDLKEILHEYASCTHNSYLSLAKKIVNDDQ